MIGRIHASCQYQSGVPLPSPSSGPLLVNPSGAPISIPPAHRYEPYHHMYNATTSSAASPPSSSSAHSRPFHSNTMPNAPVQKPTTVPIHPRPGSNQYSSLLYNPSNTITLPPSRTHRAQTLHPSAWSTSRLSFEDMYDYDHTSGRGSGSSETSFASWSSSNSEWVPRTPPASMACPYTLAPCLKTVPLPDVEEDWDPCYP